jgi:hypothetical protein
VWWRSRGGVHPQSVRSSGPGGDGGIDPEAFEEAREDAGISFATFVASVLRDANGFPYEVSILVEETIRGNDRRAR